MRPAGCAIRRSKLPADATATCTNSQNERCERADTVRCWWVGLTERESERYGGDGRREMSPDRRARVRDRGNIWATLCCASTGIYERTQAIKVLRLRSVGAPSPPYKGSVKRNTDIKKRHHVICHSPLRNRTRADSPPTKNAKKRKKTASWLCVGSRNG